MDDLVGKLTPEQALQVVVRLTQKGSKIREAVLAVVMSILTEIDLDEVADVLSTCVSGRIIRC